MTVRAPAVNDKRQMAAAMGLLVVGVIAAGVSSASPELAAGLAGLSLVLLLVAVAPSLTAPLAIVALIVHDSAFSLPQAIETAVGNGLIVILGGVGLIWYLQSVRTIPKVTAVWTALATFAVASAAYSWTPLYSGGKGLIFLSAVIFFLWGIATKVRDDPQMALRLEKAVFLTLAGLLALNFIALALPSSITWHLATGRYQGIMNHPNGLGKLCSALAPFILVRCFGMRQRYSSWVVPALAVAMVPLIALAHPRASTAAILGATATVLLLKRRWITMWVGVTALTAVLVLDPVREATVDRALQFATRGDQNTIRTLTGRTTFWSAAKDFVVDQPRLGFLGMGYQAGGRILTVAGLAPKDRETLIENSPKTHLHNAVIEIGVGLGIIGLSLWMFAILLTFKAALALRARAVEKHAQRIALQWILLILVGLAEGMTSSTLTGEQSITNLVFLTISGIGIGLLWRADAVSNSPPA